MTNHSATYGVLTDTHMHKLIVTDSDKQIEVYRVPLPAHIGDVYTLATQCEISHLWIMPDTRLATTNTRAFIENADSTIWDMRPTYTNYEQGDTQRQHPKEDTRVKYVNVWKRNTSGKDGRAVKIHFPAYTEWAKEPGWQIETPQDLLGTLYYLHTALNTSIEWNAGHVGLELFKSLHTKHPEWIRTSELLDQDRERKQQQQETQQELMYPFSKCAGDIHWRCEQLPDNAEGQYIHVVDRNNAYLAGARSAMLGAGDPIHRTGKEITDDTLPGAYLVTYTTNDSPFDGKQLPLLFSKSGWVSADILKYAREKGYSVTVSECYQFEEKHRTFDTLALALWNARESFHPIRSHDERYTNARCKHNAYLSLKAIAHVVIGKFAGAWTPLYRPDWTATIVGRARETQFRKMFQLYLQGVSPCFVNSDAMYFLSPDADPQTAIPGIFERDDQLGGYKYVYSVQVDTNLIETWKNPRVSLSNYLKNKMTHVKAEV